MFEVTIKNLARNNERKYCQRSTSNKHQPVIWTRISDQRSSTDSPTSHDHLNRFNPVQMMVGYLLNLNCWDYLRPSFLTKFLTIISSEVLSACSIALPILCNQPFSYIAFELDWFNFSALARRATTFSLKKRKIKTCFGLHCHNHSET